MNDNEYIAVSVIIGIFTFLFGFLLGMTKMYDDHRNAIEIGYFISPEEIIILQKRKSDYEQAQKASNTEKWGIHD